MRIRSLLAAVAAGLLAVGTLAAPAAAVIPGPAPIVGGAEVSDDAYPFMAAVLAKGESTVRERQFCGGSLLDPQLVVTAAHCVTGAAPAELEVVVGRTRLSAEQGQTRQITEVYSHPRYVAGEEAYDVAFLWLDRPVTGISPVLLPTQGADALLRPGQLATVMGWGNTDTRLPHTPDRLRQVDVPILTHAECQISYPDYNRKVNFCAGVEGRDSCQGDSGGPIFRVVPGTDEVYQIGVVSYGAGCAAQGAPGVYTSLSSAELWQTLWESEANAPLKARLHR